MTDTATNEGWSLAFIRLLPDETEDQAWRRIHGDVEPGDKLVRIFLDPLEEAPSSQ